jgi:hypothetical protein
MGLILKQIFPSTDMELKKYKNLNNQRNHQPVSLPLKVLAFN